MTLSFRPACPLCGYSLSPIGWRVESGIAICQTCSYVRRDALAATLIRWKRRRVTGVVHRVFGIEWWDRGVGGA